MKTKITKKSSFVYKGFRPMKEYAKIWVAFFLISTSFTIFYLRGSVFCYSSLDYEKYKPFIVALMTLGGTGIIDRAYALFQKIKINPFYNTKTSFVLSFALLLSSLSITQYIIRNICITHPDMLSWADDFIYPFLINMGMIYAGMSVIHLIVLFTSKSTTLSG